MRPRPSRRPGTDDRRSDRRDHRNFEVMIEEAGLAPASMAAPRAAGRRRDPEAVSDLVADLDPPPLAVQFQNARRPSALGRCYIRKFVKRQHHHAGCRPRDPAASLSDQGDLPGGDQGVLDDGDSSFARCANSCRRSSNSSPLLSYVEASGSAERKPFQITRPHGHRHPLCRTSRSATNLQFPRAGSAADRRSSAQGQRGKVRPDPWDLDGEFNFVTYFPSRARTAREVVQSST